MTTEFCDDCHGYTHMPWCPSYEQLNAEHHDAPAAPERGERWSYSWESDGYYYVRRPGVIIARTGNESDAITVTTTLNQHSTLSAQRERLLRLLRPVTSPTACYCAVMGSEKCWHCEARELITAIEQDQIVNRTTTGREE